MRHDKTDALAECLGLELVKKPKRVGRPSLSSAMEREHGYPLDGGTAVPLISASPGSERRNNNTRYSFFWIRSC